MGRFPVTKHTSLYVNGSFHVSIEATTPRFEVGVEAVAHLRREGFVVIKNCNYSEVAHARELLWSYMEGTGQGVRRDSPATWVRNQPNPYGIFWLFGAGHSRLAWFLRTRPQLRRMFALVWDTEDLIASFEGFSMFPPAQVEDSWRLGEAWFHTDQNHRSRPGLQTIQSFTSLYDQDESTGGFVVVPRSWERHAKVTARIYQEAPRTPEEQQFLMVPPNDPVLSRPHVPRLIKCHAGDTVMWDSRTVHCSTPSLRNRETVERTSGASESPKAAPRAAAAPSASALGKGWQSEGTDAAHDVVEPPARVAVYCSMAPRTRASDDVLLARQRALLAHQTCTHWPFDTTCLESPEAMGHPSSDPLRRAFGVHKSLVGYTDGQIQGWLSGRKQPKRRRIDQRTAPDFSWSLPVQLSSRVDDEVAGRRRLRDVLPSRVRRSGTSRLRL